MNPAKQRKTLLILTMGTGAGREEGILAVGIAEINILRRVRMSDCAFGKTRSRDTGREKWIEDRWVSKSSGASSCCH